MSARHKFLHRARDVARVAKIRGQDIGQNSAAQHAISTSGLASKRVVSQASRKDRWDRRGGTLAKSLQLSERAIRKKFRDFERRKCDDKRKRRTTHFCKTTASHQIEGGSIRENSTGSSTGE